MRSISRTRAARISPGFSTCLLAIELVLGWTPAAIGGGIVTEASEAALRAAMAGGGTVSFEFDGTILLTAPLVVTNDTRMVAAGRQVTLSGGNSVRLLQVTTGTALELWDLTLADGRAQGSRGTDLVPGGPAAGGAILNEGGSLTLVSCRFTNNAALGGDAGPFSSFTNAVSAGGAARGGAVYSSGSLRMTNCVFVANRAKGGIGGPFSYSFGPPDLGRGGEGAGGAVFKASGMGLCVGTSFFENEAAGGVGGDGGTYDHGKGGDAKGGAVHSALGDLQVQTCRFGNNRAIGAGTGWRWENGGWGWGGAVSVTAGSFVAVGSRFTSNSVTGGPVGKSGSGGMAHGGAVSTTGGATFYDCLVQENQAVAGPGGGGGLGLGGGIFADGMLTIDRSTIALNSASGGTGASLFGSGGKGSPARGGGIFCSEVLEITNTTLATNVATGGPCFDIPGTGGDASGGGIYQASGTGNLRNVTLAGSRAVVGIGLAPVGWPSGLALGDNLSVTNSNLTLANTILSGSATNNCHGSVTDAGGNMSSDASCGFTQPDSQSNVDPMLGLLADNGGPTPTMALLEGSPAIDAGNATFCPLTDQRGQPRPMGSGCDIGAYEMAPMESGLRLSVTMTSPRLLSVRVDGPPSGRHVLERSPDGVNWAPISTNSTLPFAIYETI